MSGILPADDQDFFFTAPIIEENDWFSSTPRKSAVRGFLLAIVVSLTIHAVIFQLNIPQQPSELPASPSQPIHITLDYSTPTTSPLIEPEVAPLADIQPQAVVEKVAPLPEANLVEEAETVEILPRAAANTDLETIVLQQNKYRDDYLPSSDFTPRVEHPNDSSSATQFGNVFDPRLRARLQNTPSAIVKRQATGPVAFTGVHGDTVVELDSGLCMEASSAAIGQPTNWYMTACAGKLSESEQMMERINKEVRSRRFQQ